ncbi:MAG: serine hydrolase domain-containing protein [Gemmatimonadaceae bacterium]
MLIDSLLAPFSAPGRPGASLLVVRHDTVLVRKAVGLADVGGGVPATSATNYRLASLTKQFTATAIVLLVEDGVLTLDTPVRSILPELPSYAASVTLRHLLTHTSGLWDYEAFVPDSQQRQVTDRDALDLVRTHADSLYFPPGSGWRYSNTGYALLSLIVERKSGMSFPDFLRTRIFAPLGMTNSLAHVDGRDTIPHRAYGHTVRGDTVSGTDQSNTSAVLGDGGIYSSIDDMTRWYAALTARTLVDGKLWNATITPYVLSDGKPTEYGFGWFIDRFEDRARLRHHGETRGFTNFVARFPEEGLTILLLTNRTDSAPWDIVDALARRYLAQ